MNNVEQIEYKKDFMKISFEKDDDLPLGNILCIAGMIILVVFVYQEDNKHYKKVCLHKCVHEIVN